MLVVYRIEIPVHYCERHFRDLRSLTIRQWGAMLLVPALLFLGVGIELAGVTIASDSVLTAILATAGGVSLFLAFYFGHRIGRQRGIRISTQGSSQTFLVIPSNEPWAEKARKNVARYYEHHSTAGA